MAAQRKSRGFLPVFTLIVVIGHVLQHQVCERTKCRCTCPFRACSLSFLSESPFFRMYEQKMHPSSFYYDLWSQQSTCGITPDNWIRCMVFSIFFPLPFRQFLFHMHKLQKIARTVGACKGKPQVNLVEPCAHKSVS